MDKYWDQLKKQLREAADNYGLQDNVEAAEKARTLRGVIRTMEQLEDDGN